MFFELTHKKIVARPQFRPARRQPQSGLFLLFVCHPLFLRNICGAVIAQRLNTTIGIEIENYNLEHEIRIVEFVVAGVSEVNPEAGAAGVEDLDCRVDPD